MAVARQCRTLRAALGPAGSDDRRHSKSLGWGPGSVRVWLTDAVAIAAPLTVFHHPAEVLRMYKHILFPTDGSQLTAKALQSTLNLATLLQARLSVIAVKDPFPYGAISEMQPTPPQEFIDAQERIAVARVQKAVDAAVAAGVAAEGHTVEAVHPWEAIIEHAKAQGCDLIVMASHGRRGLSALLLGSETQKVLTHTDLPVLVVR
jgi:nucleotide-binding universal stress UspA family protein